jgi:hypothetical protein
MLMFNWRQYDGRKEHVEKALKIVNDNLALNLRLQVIYTDSASKTRTSDACVANEIMLTTTNNALKSLGEMRTHLMIALSHLE